MHRLSPLELMALLGGLLALMGVLVALIGRERARFVWAARAAWALSFVVIVMGAFVRLSDAGLGCPDWPGCYGDLTPATARHVIAEAELARPAGPVTLAKAWKEMIHRYLAGTLGALIVALAIAAWRGRRVWSAPVGLAAAAVGVVVLQGAFGAWTVTLLLKPAIVTGHLIGGLLTLSLLWVMVLQASGPRRPVHEPDEGFDTLARWAWALLALVIVQIVLGGWVSTNYAALACPDWPTCRGDWVPALDFANAFHVVRELGVTAQGDALPIDALTAIHWTHRTLAWVVAALGASVVVRVWAHAGLRPLGVALAVALGTQIALGISNVVFGLPLLVAVAHHAGAASLLLIVTTLVYRTAPAALPREVPVYARSSPWPNL